MLPEIESWRFNIDLLRKAFVYEPAAVPDDADLRLIVDPAYSAKTERTDTTRPSDCSALIVNFKSERPGGDGIDLNIVDGCSGRFKGIALADEIVRLAGLWNLSRICVEQNGPGCFDLLKDIVEIRAAERDVRIPEVRRFAPYSHDREKARRIRKIEDELMVMNPPALKIYCRHLFEEIVEQASRFQFETARREDGLLDVIALSATRGEL